MGNLGIGVMLGMLSGNKETVDTFQKAVGKTIEDVRIEDNELRFTFNDGTGLCLSDDGQSCCEHRYMHTDDDLEYFVGSKLLNAEIREAAEEWLDSWEVQESQFLIVTTDKGQFTVVNYNEHNGYYGGFWIVAREFDPSEEKEETG